MSGIKHYFCWAVLLAAVFFPGMLRGETALAEQQGAGETPVARNEEGSSALGSFEYLRRGVKTFTLSNGLRVVFLKRDQSPVFSGHIWVRAGGVDEIPGKTGVAHLLEHMAFKGTDRIGTRDFKKEQKLMARYEELLEAGDSEQARQERPQIEQELQKLWINDQFSVMYQERGASGLNAATGKDYTFYLVSLPSAEFEFWCAMESERLLRPVFRQFYKELKVVQEERRMRTEDNPAGKLNEALMASAYWAHPYRLPTIGWESDLKQLREKDIEEFHQRYYRPDNMVIALVGSLEIAQVRLLLEQYFGRLQQPRVPIPRVTVEEPTQEGQRRALVIQDAEPRIVIGFHKPVYPDRDDISFTVLHALLSDARTSRFQQQLVREQQLATSIDTGDGPGSCSLHCSMSVQFREMASVPGGW